MNNSKKYLIPLALVTCLFFMWGLANNLTGILIPQLRKALVLSNTQSTFVDTAIYFAYFVTAIPAGILLKKIGYKNGIITGLLFFSLGCFLFVPAANMRNFPFFLVALFIIGIGLATLETAANPYVTKLGPEKNASTRLNLAQSFNGLAATLAPLLGSMYILSGKEYSSEELNLMPELERLSYLSSEAEAVKAPYFIIGVMLIVLAALFLLIKFPKLEEETSKNTKLDIIGALQFNHLRWAVVAQFFYVGAQVCMTSFFIRMAILRGGLEEKEAGTYLALYGFLFMLGRFAGTFISKFIQAANLLALYAGISIILCLVAINLDGLHVVIAIGILGFFLSIMFPTIFSLGIENLGEHTKTGSALIVMSIIGGAIFPVIMGEIIDLNNDHIQTGYFVPLICFVVILIFALKSRIKIEKV